MASQFEFNAPQHLSINDEENIDRFFHEVVLQPKPTRRTTFNLEDKENAGFNDKYTLDQRLNTPMVKSKKDDEGAEYPDCESLLEKINNLQIDNTKMQTPLKTLNKSVTSSTEKRHKMVTRLDKLIRTPMLDLRTRSIVRIAESDNETDESMLSAVSNSSIHLEDDALSDKVYSNMKRSSEASHEFNGQPSKFVALAEQIANFHKETPDRFRSKPHNIWRPSLMKPLFAVPKGPSLTTLRRNRSIFYPTKEEREQQEFNEMQKHQIKANPVNKRILEKTSLGLKAPVIKRQSTCPVPFKLTETNKPKPIEEAQLFQFKAQPVPFRILQSPVGIPPKRTIAATTPKTPAIRQPVRYKVEPSNSAQNLNRSTGSTESLPRNTKLQPFSFEERDKALLARKQDHIKKVLEEEKKACSSFVANPIRKFTQRAATPIKTHIDVKKTTTPKPFNLTQPKAMTDFANSQVKVLPFKANPASVLKKIPFYPRHRSHTPLKVQAFDFKTDSRLIERKVFDEKIKQHEEEVQAFQDKARKVEEQKIMGEVKELRKIAEFKAKPIPITKPFKIEESKIGLTQPISPHFRSGKQKKTDD